MLATRMVPAVTTDPPDILLRPARQLAKLLGGHPLAEACLIRLEARTQAFTQVYGALQPWL